MFPKETVDGQFTATVADVTDFATFVTASPTNAPTGQPVIVSHGRHLS